MNHYIFIIDDDPDDVEFIVEALRDHGYTGRAEVFYSGRDFIERLKTRESESGAEPVPDLVILDINMQLVSGFECFDYLKNSPYFRHVPVIFLSTSQMDRDLSKARDMQAAAYLYKPDSYKDYGKMGKAILDFLSNGQKEGLAAHGMVFQSA